MDAGNDFIKEALLKSSSQELRLWQGLVGRIGGSKCRRAGKSPESIFFIWWEIQISNYQLISLIKMETT